MARGGAQKAKEGDVRGEGTADRRVYLPGHELARRGMFQRGWVNSNRLAAYEARGGACSCEARGEALSWTEARVVELTPTVTKVLCRRHAEVVTFAKEYQAFVGLSTVLTRLYRMTCGELAELGAGEVTTSPKAAVPEVPGSAVRRSASDRSAGVQSTTSREGRDV